MYFKKSLIIPIAGITAFALSQQIAQDPGTGGVPIEVVHLYNDEYPQGFLYFLSVGYVWTSTSDRSIGIAVSSTGRMFSNYARLLDPNNLAYTVAELTGNNTETPYPSAAINLPPGVRINLIRLISS